jgi:hypothetical protein
VVETTVEFELGPDEVSRALGLRSDQAFGYGMAVTTLVASGVCYALYDAGHRPRMWIPALLLLVYAAVSFFYGAIYMPRKRRAAVGRLGGQVRVMFADDGIRYSSQNTAKGFSWPKIQSVVDTPGAWIITARGRHADYVVPKAAVGAERAEEFEARLREWSGKAYKSRRK